MTIWKFPLKIQDRQTLVLPIGATPLHVGVQDGTICMWVQLDQRIGTQDRTVRIIGTGHPFEDAHKLSYVGTAHTGGLVLHVYMQDVP